VGDWKGKGRGKEEDAYLRLLTLHPLHLLKRLEQRPSPLLQPRRNTLILLLVKRIARLPLLGRIHLHLHETLPDDGRAEHDADELVHLRRDLRVEADELEISAPMPAFAHHAFGDAVERGQFQTVVFTQGFFLQVSEALFEGGEVTGEDVGLVDFVAEHDQFFLGGEFEHAAHVCGGEVGAGGVAGVYDHDRAHVCAFCFRFLVCVADGRHIRAPGLAFVEVVGHAACVEHGESGGVEGILRYRHQDPRLGLRADDVHERVDA